MIGFEELKKEIKEVECACWLSVPVTLTVTSSNTRHPCIASASAFLGADSLITFYWTHYICDSFFRSLYSRLGSAERQVQGHFPSIDLPLAYSISLQI